MEELNNLNVEVESTIKDVAEVATEKITFKDNIVAYGLAGVFVTGLATIGYLGYKGTKKLWGMRKSKKEFEVVTEETFHSDATIDDENDDDNEDYSE